MIVLKKVGIICSVISLVLLLSCSSSDGQEGYETISKFEALELISDSNVVVLDVRTPEEVSKGVIPGAVALDYYSSSFESDLDKLDNTRKVLVYCRSGARSTKACRLLTEHGFTSVYNLKGGFNNWRNE